MKVCCRRERSGGVVGWRGTHPPTLGNRAWWSCLPPPADEATHAHNREQRDREQRTDSPFKPTKSVYRNPMFDKDPSHAPHAAPTAAAAPGGNRSPATGRRSTTATLQRGSVAAEGGAHGSALARRGSVSSLEARLGDFTLTMAIDNTDDWSNTDGDDFASGWGSVWVNDDGIGDVALAPMGSKAFKRKKAAPAAATPVASAREGHAGADDDDGGWIDDAGSGSGSDGEPDGQHHHPPHGDGSPCEASWRHLHDECLTPRGSVVRAHKHSSISVHTPGEAPPSPADAMAALTLGDSPTSSRSGHSGHGGADAPGDASKSSNKSKGAAPEAKEAAKEAKAAAKAAKAAK